MASRYGLEIRAATSADSAGLAALFQAAGHSVAAGDLAERLDSQRSAAGATLVALEWGPPSGLVVLHWYRSLVAPHPVAQITTLLVGPDERRRGIGRLLVKAASQAARSAGCGALELAVLRDQAAVSDHARFSDQAAMRAFCESTGFEPAGGLFTRNLRKRSVS